MRGRGSRRAWSGADVASVAASRRRCWRGWSARSRRGLKHRNARLQGLHGCLVGRFGELDGPGRLVAGIDLEKAGAIIAAREAIVRTADGELLFPRAHECLAGPFSAAVIVDRIDVIEARNERAPQHGLAAAGGSVPPAFGGPAFVLLVPDRDAEPVAGIVAEAEFGRGWLGGHRDCRVVERPVCVAARRSIAETAGVARALDCRTIAIGCVRACSWLRPSWPLPRSVTVSSPPESITARRPCAVRSRASRACAAATSRASPSIAVPSRTHS